MDSPYPSLISVTCDYEAPKTDFICNFRATNFLHMHIGTVEARCDFHRMNPINGYSRSISPEEYIIILAMQS